MDAHEKWKKILKSGNYRRKVNQYRKLRTVCDYEDPNNNASENVSSEPQDDLFDTQALSLHPEDSSEFFNDDEQNSDEDSDIQNAFVEEYSPDEASDSDLENSDHPGIYQDVGSLDADIEPDTYEDESLSTFLRKWSLEFNISQNAMKPLMQKLTQYDRTLPNSPRRLLRTPRNKPSVINIEGGEYWHQGVGKIKRFYFLLLPKIFMTFFIFTENCLRQTFFNLTESCIVSINVNIDGLPLYKNGTHQVWPILFNIHGRPEVKPMIAGIFYGRTKPKKIEEFLNPFVSEILPILQNGIQINEIKLNVNIRAIICDSPARAFIKGKSCTRTDITAH